MKVTKEMGQDLVWNIASSLIMQSAVTSKKNIIYHNSPTVFNTTLRVGPQ